MPSLTVENYLKSIYKLCPEGEAAPASTGKLAEELAVSPGTVTSMLKTLDEQGLVTYTPYEGVRLTGDGRRQALKVLRRHRLIELFLAQTLGMAWDEVHEEAEELEHALSERLVERIDAFLGRPEVDPHGDPIPQADGTLRSQSRRSLADCGEGESFRLTRVLDQSPEFLRYLSDSRLALGAEGNVTSNQRASGVVTVSVGGRQTTLGRQAAEKILVAPRKAS